ncbi:MAG TPA: energy transducer TonB, partial [Pyrinomonadaceae bacterium]|nr:energy transducer TonB [Pyrinomonadaceae bacterium]
EPLYTEEARKNQVTGTVRLRLILGASGSVSGITPLTRLPDGLTEKAIEAARRIAFTPAEKDGRKVSQYVTIEYNFNIY